MQELTSTIQVAAEHPPTQVEFDPLAKDGHSPLFNALVGRLDEVGQVIVADFLTGRPYREPASIQSEIEARKSTDSCQAEMAAS